MSLPNLPPRISVALATFNGATYLPAQLQSLAAQDLRPMELVACDDLSTDGTVDLLYEFKKISPFPVHIHVNENNLGHSENFLKAARLCRGEWVAFCDQDDVWFKNKLTSAANTIISNPGTHLVLQNSYICNQDLKHSGRLFPACLRPGMYGKASLPVYLGWPGFLQTVRRQLFSDIRTIKRPCSLHDPQSLQFHDQWTLMISNALGGIIVLGDAVALYRRHPRAVTCSYQPPSLAAKVSAPFGNYGRHYSNLARVALSSADCMRVASANCNNAVWQGDLSAAADRSEKIGSILLQRASIYAKSLMNERIIHLRDILLAGGYSGRQVPGMGLKSAVKDFAAVLGFF